MTNSTRQVEATNLVRELDAKAWQSHRIGAGKAKREQHVAYRAARFIESIPASDLEQVIRERDEAVRLLRGFVETHEFRYGEGLDPTTPPNIRATRAFLSSLDNRND